MLTMSAAQSTRHRAVHIDLVAPRRARAGNAFLRDFAALGGLFGVLYGWFWVGSALVA